MLKYDAILIRFGELSTKGKNKKDFIKRLYDNLKLAFKDLEDVRFERSRDHIYLYHDSTLTETVVERLKEVSGIISFSRVFRVGNDLEAIKDGALEFAKMLDLKTFKVKARRADKSFPVHSDELNRHCAGKILANTSYRVDVHNPELLLEIEVRQEGTFIYGEKIKGAGGYPLGVAGKALVMLSGGIDSPVAAYLAMKRGIKIEAIHYASPPYTSSKVKEKITDILKVLSRHRLPIKLHIVPFTKIQETIYEQVPEAYAITIMRRMMYRLAERLCYKRNCLAIVNGESVGQVASQTLVSLRTINAVTNLPVLRPLATMDKLDIIELAQKIGTYEISIRPYIDCCTIFNPKNPVTRPDITKVEEFESRFDFQSLLSEAIKNVESLTIDENYQEVQDSDQFF